jgi:hypothetical protein
MTQQSTASKVQTSADRKLKNLTHRGKGRKKGVPNRVGATLREVVAMFVENNAQGAQALYDRVAAKHPAKALELLARFAEFVLPKQREISGTLASFHFDASASVSDVAEQQRILAQVFADPNFDMSTVPQFASLALPAAARDAVEAIIEQPLEHAPIEPIVDEVPRNGEALQPDPVAEQIAPIEPSRSSWDRVPEPAPRPGAQLKEVIFEQRKREAREGRERVEQHKREGAASVEAENERAREAQRIRRQRETGQL